MENTPHTVGLEFESVITNRDLMIETINKYRKLLPAVSVITRDASVESPVAHLGRSTIFLGNQRLKSGLRYLDRSVVGYELVTKPLSMPDMRRVIDQTINIQVSMGEIFSNRSSIHVHVGFPRGLIFQKVAVALGLAVEPLLYKIAGMGNRFRGLDNNSAYCRALALPPAIKLLNSDKTVILCPELSIDADGESKFWNLFGVSSGERDRYVPLRYLGLNLYSILLRGTLEFRFYNFCTNSGYVSAITRLSQFIADLILRLPLSDAIGLRYLSLFTVNSNHDYYSLLDEMVSLGKFYGSEQPLSNIDYDNIKELIDVTPQPVFVNKSTLTHVKNTKLDLSRALGYGLDFVDGADPPGIVDIHTFDSSNRNLIGDV